MKYISKQHVLSLLLLVLLALVTVIIDIYTEHRISTRTSHST